MSVRKYLPSMQFAIIVGALGLSGGLVFAAEYFTKQPQGASLAASNQPIASGVWQQSLEQIQANAGIYLPQAPDQSTVDKLVQGVESDNITSSVARSVLIQLTNAKAQGLGDDIPTQTQLIAQAAALTEQATQAKTYSKSDLTTVVQTSDSLRAYGNAVMRTFNAHSAARVASVLQAVGYAVDYHDASYTTPLGPAAKDYAALARDLAAVSVPETLAPLHLQLVNDLSAMGSAVGNMQSIVSDPLRGLSGLQTFESMNGEAARVLTTMAGTFSRSGILFSKDEPGAAWNALASGT